MSQKLDAGLKTGGTRFLVYPQHKGLKGFETPEVVYVNAPPGTIGPGPADDGIRVVYPVEHTSYWESKGRRRRRGATHPPAEPVAGHFDHIQPSDEVAFSAASAFAITRRVLDIWEDYFERKIAWWRDEKYRHLEIIPFGPFDNAYSGPGYLEFGAPEIPSGGFDLNNLYCENFDVVAHEVGHGLYRVLVGDPPRKTLESEGHKESFCDLVAIVAALHSETMLDRLLRETKGNLFSPNVLGRVGELNRAEEVRRALNDKKMSDVDRRDRHDLSLPFTGGAFDTLVEIYETLLVERRVILPDLADRSSNAAGHRPDPDIQREFARRFEDNPTAFPGALLDARDYFGRLLAITWREIRPNGLSYRNVVMAMIRADETLSGGKHEKIIRQSFAWRGIQ